MFSWPILQLSAAFRRVREADVKLAPSPPAERIFECSPHTFPYNITLCQLVVLVTEKNWPYPRACTCVCTQFDRKWFIWFRATCDTAVVHRVGVPHILKAISIYCNAHMTH